MPQSEAEARLRRATESELAIANNRLQHVIGFIKKTSTDDRGIPERTLRRWVAAYRQAENTGPGSGYLGLLPERASRQLYTQTAGTNASAHE